eukprot:6186433-Pleurochrysis_carterae.AAC.1
MALSEEYPRLPEQFCRAFRQLLTSSWHIPKSSRRVLTACAESALHVFRYVHFWLQVRPTYFMFRLPPFTGCVDSEHAVLIADNGAADE